MRREVNFACGTCGNGLVLPLASPEVVDCRRCGAAARLVRMAPVGPIEACAACGGTALFAQRDFNRLLGLLIVAVAAVFAVRTRGLSLLAAALVDLVLYRTLPRITVCYACDAIHRGVPVDARHAAYDHHVADEHKEARAKRRLRAQDWQRRHPG